MQRYGEPCSIIRYNLIDNNEHDGAKLRTAACSRKDEEKSNFTNNWFMVNRPNRSAAWNLNGTC